MPNNLVFNNVASELLTQIYGTDGTNLHAIRTDSSGRLEVVGTFTAIATATVVETRVFLDNVSGTDAALTIDTSQLSVYSFYVYNLGTNPFNVKIQVSPYNNAGYYIDDNSGEFLIDPVSSPKAVLVPRTYLKYTRLIYEANSGNISAEVWFNGKG